MHNHILQNYADLLV